MGIKIVYDRDRPPYGNVYEYHKPELVLVGRKEPVHVRQYVGGGAQSTPQVQSLEPAVTLVLKRGFYRSEVRLFGSKPTRSYFFVDDKGDVVEFPNEGALLAAHQQYHQGSLNWSHGGKWLHAEGPEPTRRKVTRDPLNRFDRIDKEIVPDLGSLPVTPPKEEEEVSEAAEVEAIVAKETRRRPSRPRRPATPQEYNSLDAALNNAVREMDAERAKAPPPEDPLGAVLDDFLKNI